MNVVFVFNEYSLHNHIVEEYLRARLEDRAALVKVPLVLKGKSRKATAARILPRLSRRFAAAKGMEFGVLLALTLMPKILPRGAVFRRLARIARRHRLPFMKSESVMAPECLDFIREQKPDVVVTLVHQIIEEPLIALPRLGVVNIHPGLLPDFRGIQPYFWELSEGSPRAGSTLHLITDRSVDTGPVLGQASFSLRPGMSVQLNYYLSARAAGRLLPPCLQALDEDRLEPRRQESGQGSYFKWPDGAAFDRLKARGHAVVSWRDLWGIICGRHDSFEPEEVMIYE